MIATSRTGNLDDARFATMAMQAMNQLRGSSLAISDAIPRFLSYVAAWVFLQWAEYEDRERQAVAEFDGEDYEPLLPEHLRTERWLEIPPDQFDQRVRLELLRHLDRPTSNPLADRVRWVVNSETLDFPDERPAVRVDIQHWLREAFDLSSAEGRDSASQMFDALLQQSISLTKGISWYTPQPVVDLMVELGAPAPGDRVYDPCFGMGGLLVASARRIRDAAKTCASGEWKRLQDQTIFGVELNRRVSAIAMTRIVLAGITSPGLEVGDALERPRHNGAERFDLILACPPWGYVGKLPRGEQTRFGHFRVTSRDQTTLFLQHAMDALRPGGRAVMAVPDGTLFGTGADKHVRRILLEEFETEGVISLPAGTFAPFTGIKSNVLVFRRREAREDIRFLVAGRLTGTRQRGVEPEQTPQEIARKFRSKEYGKDFWTVPVKELEKRNWELVAKKTGDRELNVQLKSFSRLDESIERTNLKAVAEVFAGVSYDRRSTQEAPDDDLVGVVRIADLKSGRVVSPELFLTAEAAEKVGEDRRLRPKDIVVSKSGTIGKIAIVPADEERYAPLRNCVAGKSLAVIRVSDTVLPEFVVGVLESDTYQNWLSGHARGSAIQNLSIQSLRNLPLPVPPLLLQQRVVRQLRQQVDGDCLAVLNETLNSGAVEAHAHSAVAVLQPLAQIKNLLTAPTTTPVSTLERAAEPFLEGTAFDENIPDWCRWWLDRMEQAVAPLASIRSVAPGPTLYAVLQDVRRKLKDTLPSDDEGELIVDETVNWQLDEAVYGVIEEFVTSFEAIVVQALDELLQQIDLQATLSESSVATGVDTELQLTLRNAGVLPLRAVALTTQPEVGSGRIAFLAEEGHHSLAVTIPAQIQGGKFHFQLEWKGQTLDGTEVGDAIDLAIEVQTTRNLVHTEDFGASPYVAGPPIDRIEMFIGRDEAMNRIRRQLSTSHRANVLLLEGNRRSGKTSILKRLAVGDVLDGWLPVYCSFQSGTGDSSKIGLPTAQVFRTIAIDIFKAAARQGTRTWFPDENVPESTGLKFQAEFIKAASRRFGEDDPFETFQLFLQAVFAAIEPNRLLLMLDEFDKLQAGIESGVTSPQIPENIRFLLHEYPSLSAILSYPRQRGLRRHEYWSVLFGLGHTIPVGALSSEDAKQLVTRPAEGKLVYVDQARDHIVELCAGQPFLIQTLCNHIFEEAAGSGDRTVTLRIVKDAAKAMAHSNEHFATLWNLYVDSERRKFILALCLQLEESPDPLNIRLLEIKLEEAGIIVRNQQQLIDDLDHLRELELLSMDSGGAAYHLTIPLMGEWIRHNIDIEGQKRRAVRESEEDQA